MNVDLINVVLVEDDKNVQVTLKDLLVDEIGVSKVVIKESPGEFLQYLKVNGNINDTHLIILDLCFSSDTEGYGGLELLKWLKGDPNLKHIPICVITGSTDRSEMLEAKELGACVYLRKPVQIQLLKYMIYELPMFKTLVCLA